MPQNYIIIGGAAYQPGSAAAKKAQQLFNAMPQAPATSQVPFPSTPSSAAPSNFPSYPTLANGQLSPNAIPAPGASNLTGANAMAGHGAYGLVPQIPNPVSTAMGSIAGNQTNLGALTTLGTGTTQLNANLGAMPYNMNLPGYQGLLGQSSQNILSNLKGVIDPSTWEQLQQKMAERGTSVGITPNSPNFDTALMRALGENITATEALGQQQFNAAIGRTPTGQPFNVAGQQLNPADLQAAQYAANVNAAAPDPTMSAQANLDALLRAIEAGRQATTGMGAPGLPRMPQLPQIPQIPLSMGSGGGGGGYSQPTYPAASPYGGLTQTQTFDPTQFVNQIQNPLTDYSVGPGWNPYPVDMTGQLDYPDMGMDSSVGPGGAPYPTDYTEYFNALGGY